MNYNARNSKVFSVRFERVFFFACIALLSLLAVSTSVNGQIATAGLQMAAGLAGG